MKILLVTTAYPPPYGGIHVVARNLEEDLIARGHEVRLLNFDGKNTGNYRRIKLRDLYYTAATKNEYYRLRKIMNPLLILKKGGYREFVHYNLIYRLTHKNIKDFKPDVIHILTPDIYTAIYGCSVPYVVTCYSEEVKDELPIRYALKNATRIHCISRYTEKMVLSVNPNVQDKTRVIYCSVDLMQNDIEELSGDKSTIISVGRLVKGKNFANIIKAYGLLDSPVRTNHKLVIIGVGPEEKNLLLLVKSLKLENQVYFKGKVSEEEKNRLLSQAKIFLLCPTRYNQEEEGFGIVFIEAQAKGLPVIGSRTGGVPEAIGRGGLLVNNELEPTNIKIDLERLLLNEKKYQKVKQLAIENVKKFDRQKWIPQFEALYQETIDINVG